MIFLILNPNGKTETMRDTETRGVVLAAFYENEQPKRKYPKYDDLQSGVEKDDFLRVCDELGSNRLIKWIPETDGGGIIVDGYGKITPVGIEAIQSAGKNSPLEIEFPMTLDGDALDASEIRVNGGEALDIVSAFRRLIEQISASGETAEEKQEALDGIKNLLGLPLVARALSKS